jgi:prepilin-type processing-associated H-X9-DG protein
MNKYKGLTRAEVIVTAACLVLLAGNLRIITAGGRNNAKLQICLANLKTMASAWQVYAGDNNSKVPVGDVYYSWLGSCTPAVPQLAWTEWPHRFPHSMPPSISTNNTMAYPVGSSIPLDAWEHAIAEGTMWKYVGDYNIYRCPGGDKGAYVSYSMSQSMNTDTRAVAIGAPIVINISQIIKPAERFVFLDTGVAKKGAFYLHYGYSRSDSIWYDLPPMRHNQGTNFVFADGHTEYRQWTDPHAIEATKHPWGGEGWANASDYCDCDLRWMTKITWGNVPYYCSNPDKQCEY